MDIMQIIKNRRSVRTFDGRELSSEDKDKLHSYIENIENPYKIPVKFFLLNAKKYGLASSVIKGTNWYIAAKVVSTPHSEEAFGFSFEKMVLYACSIGIGTTWLAKTFERPAFEKAIEIKDGEFMYCVTPIGYPANEMSEKEIQMRKALKADERKSENELFFDKNFDNPLKIDENIKNALNAVKLAPSATNKQPWRIVKDGNKFHFYVAHTKGYATKDVDVQKIDIGIALCNFMSVADGTLKIENPNISSADNVEYIATVTI